tara:strand:- start:1057 stop:1827 length:771 start_codon:yes stop_codon:yes gene_type:complete
MTHFSDGIATGNAAYGTAAPAPGLLGRSNATRNPQVGVNSSPVQIYRLAVLATASATNLNAGTTTYSGPAVSIPLSAGTGVTSTTLFGNTVYDIVGQYGERGVQVTPAPGNTAASVTIVGYDMNEVPVTATFSSTASGGSAADSNKTFRYILSAAVNGNTTSSIQLGVSDVVGFPIRINSQSDFIATMSGTVVTINGTGFTAADATVPATALTNNVRGSYKLQTATNAANVLTMWLYPVDINTTSGAYGVNQFPGN